MTRLYRDDGTHCPVTVLSLDGCQVVGRRTAGRDGYDAVRVGAGAVRPKGVARPQRVEAEKAGVEPRLRVREFRVSPENLVDDGRRFRAGHFVAGQFVDAAGITIGKGFAGAMKRHNFGGLRASHGVSVSHRSHGSTGNSQDPGKVFRGKKMAGHMGDRRRTVQNLEVVSTDDERGVILVKGGVPGARGSWIELRDATKRALPAGVPFPAGLEGDAAPAGDAPEAKDAAPEKDAPEAEAAAAKDAAPEAKDDAPEKKEKKGKDAPEAKAAGDAQETKDAAPEAKGDAPEPEADGASGPEKKD